MPNKFMSETGFLMRNPWAIAVTRHRNVLFIANDENAIEHQTFDVDSWSHLLQRLVAPVAISKLSKSLDLPEDLNDTLLAKLLETGVLLHADDKNFLIEQRDKALYTNQGFEFVQSPQIMNRLVFACSGSIVAGLMPPTILSLYFSGMQSNLDIIITDSARRFITPDLLEHYGIQAWCDAFERRDNFTVAHVQLGSTADCIVVLPATASTLQRLASGACNDLLSLTVAASRCPLILAPVMNEAMWEKPAIQRNLQQLRIDGASIIEPTFIFGAADIGVGKQLMYGGPGTLWSGPRGLRQVISTVLENSTK